MKFLMFNLSLLIMGNTFATTVELNARERKLEVAMSALPTMKEHHQHLKELLQSKLNPEGVTIIENAIKAGLSLDSNRPDDAQKYLSQASKIADSVKKQKPEEDLLMVEYNVEVINEAPYDLKEIKQVKKSISLAYRMEDFPKTRMLLAGLESELHMQAFQISVKDYSKSLQEINFLVGNKKYSEAQNNLNRLLSAVVIEDWSVPLPYIEAQSALISAQESKSSDMAKTKQKVQEAQYQLDRAVALGYVVGEEADFKMLNNKLKELKNDIFKEQFKAPKFDILKDHLIAFIKKHMTSKKDQLNLVKKTN